jgi:hypothetical protein
MQEVACGIKGRVTVWRKCKDVCDQTWWVHAEVAVDLVWITLCTTISLTITDSEHEVSRRDVFP